MNTTDAGITRVYRLFWPSGEIKHIEKQERSGYLDTNEGEKRA